MGAVVDLQVIQPWHCEMETTAYVEGQARRYLCVMQSITTADGPRVLA